MKKTIVIALLIGLFLFMAGCGGAAGPKSAVEGFADAAKVGDIAKMKTFCTGAVLEVWDVIDEANKLKPPGADDTQHITELNYGDGGKLLILMDIIKDFQGDVEATIVEKEVTADSGKVEITFGDEKTTLICVNLDGKWLISDMEIEEGLLSDFLPLIKQEIEMLKNVQVINPFSETPGIPDNGDTPEISDDEGDGE